jgi:hypothetical protein
LRALYLQPQFALHANGVDCPDEASGGLLKHTPARSR